MDKKCSFTFPTINRVLIELQTSDESEMTYETFSINKTKYLDFKYCLLQILALQKWLFSEL